MILYDKQIHCGPRNPNSFAAIDTCPECDSRTRKVHLSRCVPECSLNSVDYRFCLGKSNSFPDHDIGIQNELFELGAWFTDIAWPVMPS